MATTKKPVMDIMKPGTVANSSSRAIIIKHPTVKDPMVVAPNATNPEASTITMPSAKKIVIQPVHNDVVADVAPAAVAPAAVTTPAIIPVDEADVEPASVSERPVIDDEKQQEDRAIAVDKLIASQHYFLPIETIEQRRSKRAIVMGTMSILLLLAAWYYVSLDAGLVSNTYNLPHSGFFTTK